jgi:sialic acid synthase SpsE
MILGTGMSTLGDVREALKAIYSSGNMDLVTLHCTSSYPCPPEQVNLRAMISMQNELGCLVGYSDHTIGLTAPIMAVTLGAVVIEKHITIDRNLPGPDHKASIEPGELKSMVQSIRGVEKMMGNSEKRPTKNEKKIIPLVRKSIVAKKDLQRGAAITLKNVAIKRPGNGLSPKNLDKILGKRLKNDIKKDSQITFPDLR